jgi:hypothetical protein
MTELKYINPMSLAKIALIINALIGIVISILTIIISTIYPAYGQVSALYVVSIPVTYAIAGFVGGFLLALLYNFLANNIGGVEVVFR